MRTQHLKTPEKREYVAQIGKIEDYLAQIDEVVAGLRGLQKRAGRIVDVYITQLCKEHPGMHRDTIEQLELVRVGSRLDYIEALERVRDRILP
ncbi:MAG: hypothetical protein C5B58_13705 [Acidobacteria bacterium]|nr:MAG: hypothetical protein C5B58_13705 [Acidobacteriota bacterium]